MDRYEAADWLFDIIIKNKFHSTSVSGHLRDKKGIKDIDFAVEVSDVLKRSGLVKEWGKTPNWNKLCATTEGIEAFEKYGSLSKYVAAQKESSYSENDIEKFNLVASSGSTINFANNIQSSDFLQKGDSNAPTKTEINTTKNSGTSKPSIISGISKVTIGVLIAVISAIALYAIFRMTGVKLY